MITTTINVNSLNRGLKKDRGFVPPNRISNNVSKLGNINAMESKYRVNVKPKLNRGKRLNISLKSLNKGKKLVIDGVYSTDNGKGNYIVEDSFTCELVTTNIDGVSLKEPNLKKGKQLDIGTICLSKGNSIKIGEVGLNKGVRLSLAINLVSGKNLTKDKNVIKYKELLIAKKTKKSKPKKAVKVKQKDKLNDLSSTKIDNFKSIVTEEVKEKSITSEPIRDSINIDDKPNKIETVGVIQEQKREENRLVKDVEDVEIKKVEDLDVKKVDDDVVYTKGMSLYNFLKENPKKRTEEIVLTYFDAKELKTLIDSGKVLKKRGKLII